jgi:hypothetical protein
MCDLGLVLGLGATLIGGVGQLEQGKATEQADKQQAQIATMNANLANQKAKDDIQTGQQQEQQKRLQTAQLMGKQRAAMAANGVDLSFGSPLDTLVDTAKMGEVDALNIRTNAYRASYEDQVQGANYTANAAIDKEKGENALDAGYLGAMGTILGGAGKAYSSANSLGYI